MNASSFDDAKIEIMLAWGDTGGSILYIVSDKKKEFFLKLSNCSGLIVVLSEYHKTYFSPMTKASVSQCFVGLGYIRLGFLESIIFLYYFRCLKLNIELGSLWNVSRALSNIKEYIQPSS